MELAVTLNETELALLARRQTGKDPSDMTRSKLLAALGDSPAPGDHARAATPTRELTLTSVQHSSMLQYTSVSVTDECKKKNPGECYAH